MRGVCSRFRFALLTPIYASCARAATPPLSPQRRRLRTRSGRPDVSFATKGPPRAPGRQNRARCARRAALRRRASDSASPPSLGRARVPPDSSISKSGPRILDLEYPAVQYSKSSGRDTRWTRGAILARPKAVLGVVLLSHYGSAAGHARFDRSRKSTFSPAVWASGRRRGR